MSRFYAVSDSTNAIIYNVGNFQKRMESPRVRTMSGTKSKGVKGGK